MGLTTKSWIKYSPDEGAERLSHNVTLRFRDNEPSNSKLKIKKKTWNTVNVDNNCSHSVPALGRNCLYGGGTSAYPRCHAG
jgi:hypothetical protein